MAIRAGEGDAPIVALAIEKTLERKGIAIDPETRELDEASISTSRVKGGGARIVKAAAVGPMGSAVIGLDAAARLPIQRPWGQRVLSLLGRDEEAVARAKLKGYTASLWGAAHALSRYVERFDYQKVVARDLPTFVPYSEVGEGMEDVLRRLSKCSVDLDRIRASNALSYATELDVAELRQAYRGLLHSVRAHTDALVDVFDNFVLRALEQLESEIVLDPMGATYEYVSAHFGELGDHVSKIIDAEGLFEHLPAHEMSVQEAFSAIARGESIEVAPELREMVAALALNSVQHTSTKGDDADRELKTLVLDAQRANASTHRVDRYEREALGSRTDRERQIDSLKVVLKLQDGEAWAPLRAAIAKRLGEVEAQATISGSR
jgi:hypothetical protein